MVVTQYRITPACAGQINRFCIFSRAIEDHPRLRGTNLTPLLLSPLPLGSPPLARDKYFENPLFVATDGITPACAGQIIAVIVGCYTGWDHPRLRGTNWALA